MSYLQTRPVTLTFPFTSTDLYLSPPSWLRKAILSALSLVVLTFLLTAYFGTRKYYLRFEDTGEVIQIIPSLFTSRIYSRTVNGQAETVLVVARGLLSPSIKPGSPEYRFIVEEQSAASVRLPLREGIFITGPEMDEVCVEPANAWNFAEAAVQSMTIRKRRKRKTIGGTAKRKTDEPETKEEASGNE